MPGLNTTQQTELDRITSLNKADLANPGSTTTPTAPTQDSTAVLNEMIKQQLKRSDIVSSATTGSEQAVLDVRAQQAASESRITGRFDEQISNIKEAGADAFTSARESQRGFGTNRAALQQLTESTDKKVKEYEQMKTDALLQNDTQSASQISQLQVNAYQFQQQAEQQVFENIMSASGFEMQVRSEERAASQFQQNFNLQKQQLESSKQNNMLDMASQAGVTLENGETYESLSLKIANSDITKLTKANLQADLNKAQTESNTSSVNMFAISSLQDSISQGGSAADAVSNLAIVMTNMFNVNLKEEDLARYMDQAIVLEQQYRDSIKEDMNNTAEYQNILEPNLKNLFSITGSDKKETPKNDNPVLDIIDPDRNLRIPQTSEDVYNNLFGEQL